MKYLFNIFIIIIVNTLLQGKSNDNIFFQQDNNPFTEIQDTVDQNDTLKPSRRYDVDAVIYASGSDSLIFFVKEKKMTIHGTSELKYKDTELKSANIFIDFETSNVEATGIEHDSIPNKLVETPVLNERGEVYEGIRMKYNFKTERGYITYASTDGDAGTYSGQKIKKVDKITFFIEDGIYTTCDIDTPHFHFYGHEMKVIHQEQLISRWVWLHIGGVPLPIPIPFAVIPIQSGRRSGIIPPVYGERAGYGKSFSRFGYFWAISDYVDWNLTSDYYTRGGFALSSRTRYVKRYNFSGNFEAGYSNLYEGKKSDPGRTEQKDWSLRWVHNQTLNPTLRLDANLQFISSNYLRTNSTDINELLRNDIVSNATIFKNWEESGTSLSLNYSRTQELENGNIREVLPNLTFSKSQSYPFRKKRRTGEQLWYELISYNYNGQLQNRRNKIDGNLDIRGGVQHSINLGAAPKAGHFNISPSIRYRELWYNKRVVKNSVLVPKPIGNQNPDVLLKNNSNNGVTPRTFTEEIITDDKHELNSIRTFGLGVTASTKLYGIMQPNTLGIAAFRHTLTPSISYNYQPDFSSDKWGYFDYYTNANGERVRYNKFEREIYGGASAGEQQSINMSLGNVFEMKTMVDPTDTTAKEEKIQLLNLNATMGYNFAADSLRFSDLNLSYRTQIGSYLNFSGSSSYSIYDWTAEGRTINKTLLSQGKGLFRLTNLNFSVSTSLSGERLKGVSSPEPVRDEFDVLTGTEYMGIYGEEPVDFSIPWDVSLNFNYSYRKITPIEVSRYSNISANLNFNLTPAWKFSFTGSYDLINKEFAAPQIRVYRDLHCWEMNFTWNPIGTFTGYRFEIRVKAPQLQDLKLQKEDRFYGGKR